MSTPTAPPSLRTDSPARDARVAVDAAGRVAAHTLTGEVLVERVHWLLRLRWLAAGGMVLLPAAARWALGVGLALGPILALAALVAGYNACLVLWLRRRERAGCPQADRDACLRHIANAQIALDLLVLTVLIYLAGGVINPLAVFLVFHMAIAAILLPRRDAWAQAAWACALYAGLGLAELRWPWLHRPLAGYPADVGLHAEPLYVAGQVGAMVVTLGLIVYFTGDISRRLRRAYRQLAQANDELARLEQTKSRFLRVAAHQLRSPLAAIHSLLAVVQADAPLPPTGADALARVKARAETMMALLEEMLTLAAMKESAPDAQPREPADVAAALETVVRLHSAAAKEKGVGLELRLDRPGRVLAWPKALDDVFGNLVSNAVKYTPAGGQVDVTAGRAGRFAVVAVRDTGIGIPAKDQEKLFSEFYRAGNAKAFAGGTGLGLSIVKEIVERLGGRITLASAEHEGTTVRVELPAE